MLLTNFLTGERNNVKHLFQINFRVFPHILHPWSIYCPESVSYSYPHGLSAWPTLTLEQGSDLIVADLWSEVKVKRQLNLVLMYEAMGCDGEKVSDPYRIILLGEFYPTNRPLCQSLIDLFISPRKSIIRTLLRCSHKICLLLIYSS